MVTLVSIWDITCSRPLQIVSADFWVMFYYTFSLKGAYGPALPHETSMEPYGRLPCLLICTTTRENVLFWIK